MKILLINPPNDYSICFPGKLSLLSNRHDYCPPLGLLYIKSYIEMVSDAQIFFFNFQVPLKPSWQDFIKTLKTFQPTVIGITVNTFVWFDVCLLLKIIRKNYKDAIIVGGGVQMWLYPQENLRDGRFDIIVQGEGELTFAELITRIEKKESLDGLPGIMYRVKNNLIKSGPLRPPAPDPDLFPFPDRSVIDVKQYWHVADRNPAPAMVMASRGCPHCCTFCNNKDHHYRTRNIDKIMEEIMVCRAMGYRSIGFYDDNFNHSRKHIEALCQAFISEKIGMSWNCFSRVDDVDLELLQLMCKAGCRRICFGVESATQHILNELKKGITVEQSYQAFAMAKQTGIDRVMVLMLGLPGESIAEAQNTVKMAFEIDPDFILCYPFIPFPGTRLYDQIKGDYFHEFIKNPTPNFKLRMWPETPQQEILNLIRKFYLGFYFRPQYIMRTLVQICNSGELLVKMKMALKVLVG